MNRAEFTIDNTDSTTQRGFVTTAGSVLPLQLLANPPQVLSCIFSQSGKTAGAPNLSIANGGVANPVGAEVDVTVPTEMSPGVPWADKAHSYMLRCTVTYTNERGSQVTEVFERLLAILDNDARRKILPGETIQFSTDTWSDAFNAEIDRESAGLAGPPPYTSAPEPVGAVGDADDGASLNFSMGDQVHELGPGPHGPATFLSIDINGAASVADDGQATFATVTTGAVGADYFRAFSGSPPIGSPTADSAYIWWDDTNKEFVVRDDTGLETKLATEEVEYVFFTSGTPTLEIGKVNVLSGTVTAATLPAVVNRKVVTVQKRNLAATIPIGRTGADVINGATSYSLAGTHAGVTFMGTTTTANEWMAPA